MIIELHTGDIYDVDLPKIDHTYEKIFNKLKVESEVEYSHLLRLINDWPETKQISPYFYDFIFATNYKDAERGFIKSLLYFPPTYEAERVLFSLVDVTGSLGIPRLIGKEYYQGDGVIYYICKLFSEINEFGSGYDLDGIWTWKQIRIVLEECIYSENPLKTWEKRIEETQYNYGDVTKIYDENPEMGDKILYLVDLPYRELKQKPKTEKGNER